MEITQDLIGDRPLLGRRLELKSNSRGFESSCRYVFIILDTMYVKRCEVFLYIDVLYLISIVTIST